MVKNMKLILIRHCETDWNAGENRLQGHIDIPLNAHGKEQAKDLAIKLLAYPISKIITSDLQRAEETAKIVAFNIGLMSEPILLTKRLRECHFGSIEGKTKEEAQNIYRKTGCYKGPGEYNFIQFGGESRKDVLDRQLFLLHQLKSFYADRVLLLVGHGTSLNTLLTEFGQQANLQREEYRILEY